VGFADQALKRAVTSFNSPDNPCKLLLTLAALQRARPVLERFPTSGMAFTFSSQKRHPRLR
jgi:hypothetical protein